MSGTTPPKGRPARVRYYFDADILGLAKVVAGLRHDVTYPGDRKGTRPGLPGLLDSCEREPALESEENIANSRSIEAMGVSGPEEL
jgi:hypothetical protein